MYGLRLLSVKTVGMAVLRRRLHLAELLNRGVVAGGKDRRGLILAGSKEVLTGRHYEVIDQGASRSRMSEPSCNFPGVCSCMSCMYCCVSERGLRSVEVR